MSVAHTRQYNFTTDYLNGDPIDDRKVEKELDEIVTSLDRKVVVSATAPTSPSDGDTWIDIGIDPPAAKIYDLTNTEWIAIGSGILSLTNKSGAQRSANDVVIADPDNDNSFDTSTTANDPKVIGIVQETIDDAAAGDVKIAGKATVKTTGTVNRGEYLVHSTTAATAKATTDAGDKGVFAVALTAAAGGTCTAILLPHLRGTIDATQIQGKDVTSSAPTSKGQILYYDGSSEYALTTAPTKGQCIYYDGTTFGPNYPIDPEYRQILYDDFESMSQDATGAGGAAARAIESAYHYILEGENGATNQGAGGIITVQSDATRNGKFFLCDGTGTADSDFSKPFQASKNITVKIRFRCTGSVATKNTWFGLAEQASAPDGVEPTEGIYIHVASGANGFRGGTKNDSGEEYTSTLEAADTDWHTVEIAITSSSVTYTWDGSAQTALTTYIPNGNLGFFCTEEQVTDAQGTDIDYVYIEQDR